MTWSYGTDSGLAMRLLRESLGAGGPAYDLRLTHRCSACGSAHHGTPILSLDHGPGPFVSISRAADVTVVALSQAGPVGVDVEQDGAADFPGFERVALHPDEQLHPDERVRAGRTVVWVRKESLLKATGHGLRVEPSRLRVTAPDEPAALVTWDGPQAPPTSWMYDVATAPGHVAAVTVLAEHRPNLVVRAAQGVASA